MMGLNESVIRSAGKVTLPRETSRNPVHANRPGHAHEDGRSQVCRGEGKQAREGVEPADEHCRLRFVEHWESLGVLNLSAPIDDDSHNRLILCIGQTADETVELIARNVQGVLPGHARRRHGLLKLSGLSEQVVNAFVVHGSAAP
jgi:hypothetical protein